MPRRLSYRELGAALHNLHWWHEEIKTGRDDFNGQAGASGVFAPSTPQGIRLARPMGITQGRSEAVVDTYKELDCCDLPFLVSP
jgi:hypothetical protein